jgi:RimJ/RimL family protein N-acetyltransferase
MDEQGNVSQVRSGGGSPGSIRALKRINPHTWPEDRLKWLWEHLKTQDYAFDDISMLMGHQAFLIPLFNKDAEWYEIGDSGIAGMISILPRVSAVFHYAVWDDIGIQELFSLQRQLFDDIFTRWELNRITAVIPSFNKQAVRMATLAGFKYEGEFRKSFLKDGTYHNLFIYGLLRDEFNKRERSH